MASPLRPQNVQQIGREVAIAWNDGTESFLPLEDLRRSCPCAVCGGESDVLGYVERPKVTYVPESFELRGWQIVGGYALQPTWRDGHGSGVYSFDLLRRIAKATPTAKPATSSTNPESKIIDCILCDTKLRVPKNIGVIRVTCPKCESQWEVSTQSRLPVEVTPSVPHESTKSESEVAAISAPVKTNGNAISTLLYITWIVGMVIAVPYYNWRFARESGFATWLLFGEIVPTLKGIFWPLYLLIDNLS